MKKVIIKHKVIDVPYSPAIPALPPRAEYWVKDFDVSHTEPEDLEGWSHIPAFEGTPGIPEQQEVSHLEELRSFQSTNEDLEAMLAMEAPGTLYDVIDITAEIEAKEAEKKAKKEKKNAAKKILKDYKKGTIKPSKIKDLDDLLFALLDLVDLTEEA